MTLTVSSVGDNAQQPLSAAQTFIPDQLIAGDLKLVTDSVTVTGSATFERGTLMGVQTVPTPVTSTGTVQAHTTLVVAALPAANDTVTVDGTVITFVAADPTGNQVLIGYPTEPGATIPFVPTATQQIAQTALNLESFLVGSTDANISLMTYSLNTTNNTITLTAIAYGTAGNSYTLATSNATAFTVGHSTLQSGAANTGTATIGSVSVGTNTKVGQYTVVLTSSTQGYVYDPGGEVVGQQTMGTAFKDPQINFTITTGGSPAAGDTFGLWVGPGSGKWTVATAGATDGSQVPAGVLADYVDCTAGDVTGGVYQFGEFNSNVMTFGAGFNAANVKAQLRRMGIFLKSTLSAADPILIGDLIRPASAGLFIALKGV